jgi:CubicO group peptidase (beta-lactamase class C family)
MPKDVSMQDKIDTIVASTSDHPAQTGMVIGFLKNDQRTIRGYGTVGDSPPTGDTVFEIGSVTKVFTTALLSILAGEGVIAMDEPVARLAPELVDFHPQITLQRLATHTSGLPKMPSNILGSMLRDLGNPYAAYTSEDMLRYLSRNPPSPRRMEARQVDYSNLGMGLLGMFLAKRVGGSYEAAIVDKICEPIGMVDTLIELTPIQERRMALPHNARGKPSRNWDLPAFEGAGALKSTADDLLTFLAAHMGDPTSDLTQHLQNSHVVRSNTFAPPNSLQRLAARVSNQDPLHNLTHEGMALGWTVGSLHSDESPVHWHHGATGGYRAFMGFVLTHHIGVVILANSGLSMRDGLLGATATDHVGFAVLEHLCRVN